MWYFNFIAGFALGILSCTVVAGLIWIYLSKGRIATPIEVREADRKRGLIINAMNEQRKHCARN